jgi:hypothetical protein
LSVWGKVMKTKKLVKPVKKIKKFERKPKIVRLPEL